MSNSLSYEALVGGLERALRLSAERGANVPTTVLRRPRPGPGGELHAGRFQPIVEVSRGPHARVVRAVDREAGSEVGLKVLRSSARHDPELRERLAREGAALARIDHPNVVPVSEVIASPEPCYVMPPLEGRTLLSLLRFGQAPLGVLVRVGRDLADGLGAIHSIGLVHRGLTPATVLATQGRAILFDLLLAKDLACVDGLTRTGTFFLDPDYAAPEVARGVAATTASDLYALGVILLELALGRHPFRDPDDPIETLRRHLEEPPPSLADRPDMPRPFTELVASLLAKEPAGRPANALSVSHRLALLAVEKVGAADRPRRAR